MVLERRIAGVEREAALASALARSGSCMSVVSSDRRLVKFGLESTRWKSSFSFRDECALGSESSQSDESSSSSSIALSDTASSSSSSSDSNTGLCSAARPMATSSLNDVCFLLLARPLRLLDGRCRLADNALLYMCESSELSSSPDEVPTKNIGPFFFDRDSFGLGEFLRMGVGCAARLVCDRYDDGAPPGMKPRIILWVLISVLELPSELKLSDALSSLV